MVYTLQKSGGQDAHVRNRAGKAIVAMGQVWGIGKRRFEADWRKRMWMFDRFA